MMTSTIFDSRRNVAAQRKHRPPGTIRLGNDTFKVNLEKLESEEPIIIPTPVEESYDRVDASPLAHRRLDYTYDCSRTWSVEGRPKPESLVVHDKIEYDILANLIRPYLLANQSIGISKLEKLLSDMMRKLFPKSK